MDSNLIELKEKLIESYKSEINHLTEMSDAAFAVAVGEHYSLSATAIHPWSLPGTNITATSTRQEVIDQWSTRLALLEVEENNIEQFNY